MTEINRGEDGRSGTLGSETVAAVARQVQVVRDEPREARHRVPPLSCDGRLRGRSRRRPS